MLSVLVPTRDPGPRVAAALAGLRDVANEIVIAADSRVGEDDLRWYATVADKLLRFEFTGSNRSFAWLHAQASGSWILRLAGDEVPSTALCSRLPELCDSTDVLQYWLPTRWLYPDAGHWLEELPWFPDYHNRLMRNDGSLWFPGLKHSGAGALRPARFLHEPLYHLDTVIRSQEQRQAKVKRYDAEAPGLRAPGGQPLNASYYLPELYARRPPIAVPHEDREPIERALHPVAAPPPPPLAAEPPLAAAAEVDGVWARRQFSAGGYRASIRPIEADRRMAAGEQRAVALEVTNQGTELWPWAPEQDPQIRVAYRWYALDGELLEPEGLRTPLPCWVRPGESCIVPATVIAPSSPGMYALEFDLVHEPVRWFGLPLRLEMAVEAT